MLVALAGGRPGVASGLFCLAAIAAFLAHEPLCVLAGVRGQRARKQAGQRAAWMLGSTTAVFAAAALVATALSPTAALAGVAPASLAVGLGILAVRRRERSAVGEVLAAAALSGAALPIAVAAGTDLSAAAATWLAWTAGLGAATVAVRAVIDGARGHARLPGALTAAPLAAAPGAVWLVSSQHQLQLLGALPLLLMAAVLFARLPRPPHLRAVGWTLAAATLLSGVSLVAANHADQRHGESLIQHVR